MTWPHSQYGRKFVFIKSFINQPSIEVQYIVSYIIMQHNLLWDLHSDMVNRNHHTDTDQSTSRIETFAKCGEYLSLSFSGVCLTSFQVTLVKK